MTTQRMLGGRLGRATVSLALAIGCLAGCNSQPRAQAAVDDPKLLTRIGGGVHTLECPDADNECWVPLVITQEETSSTQCVVGWVFEAVSIPKNTKVIWYLNKATGYSFDATNGIDIKQNNGAFSGNGHNGNRRYQFKWMSNQVGSQQQRNYDINVIPANNPQRKCRFEDPTIINRG